MTAPRKVALPALVVAVGTAELALEAIRGEASRRRRVAEQLAGEIRAQKLTGELKDVRTHAVKVLELLGEADALEEFAKQLDGTAPVAVTVTTVASDGEAVAARAAAALADVDPPLCPPCADGRCQDHDDDTDEGAACRCPNCYDVDVDEAAGDVPVIPPADDPDLAAAKLALGGGK